MTRLFKRAVNVTISRVRYEKFFGQTFNSLVINGLRVTFSIDKRLGSEPNRCELAIYNLSKETRSFVEDSPVHVRLDAGYDGEFHLMFQGDVLFARSYKDGTEWITEIQVEDGGRAWRRARISKSFKSGVKVYDALDDVCKAMNLITPTGLDVKELRSAEYSIGAVLDGRCRDELTRILLPFDLDWSIQDGELQILKRESVRPDGIVVWSEDTGLIGSPEVGTPSRKGGKPVYSARALLYPGLKPGQRINIQSRGVNGFFRIESLTHQGDTEGGDMITEVECKAA